MYLFIHEMQTFDLWHLDLFENNIPVLHILSPESVPKIHKIDNFWQFIPHCETKIGHFVARLMATSSSVSVLMKWGCCGHWGCWGSWWQGNHQVTKVQADFDFLRPKRLLRSLRPVMLSCLWGHRGHWGFQNHIMRAFWRCSFQRNEVCLIKFSFWKKKFWTEWWNFKWNSPIIEDWGFGGQGCYFQPKPSVISQMSASHECTGTVFMN